jgi:hypothetical protein
MGKGERNSGPPKTLPLSRGGSRINLIEQNPFSSQKVNNAV